MTKSKFAAARRIASRLPGVQINANSWRAGPLHVWQHQRSAHLAWEWLNLPADGRPQRVCWVNLTVGSPTAHCWWAFSATLDLPARLVPRGWAGTGYRTLIH